MVEKDVTNTDKIKRDPVNDINDKVEKNGADPAGNQNKSDLKSNLTTGNGKSDSAKDYSKIEQSGVSDAGEVKDSEDGDDRLGYDNIDEHKPKYNLADLRIHWFLVLAAIVITVFLSMANNVTITEALRRGLYSGAIFWILAEVIDYVFNNIK